MSNSRIRRILFVAKLIAWLIVAAKAASAQVTGIRSVVAGGGGVLRNASTQAHATIGQGMIGGITTPLQGFWYTASVFTPVRSSGVEPLAQGAGDLSVAPNPAVQFASVSFTLSNRSEIRVQVCDMQGRTLRIMDIGPRDGGRISIPIDVGSLPSGTYMVRVSAGKSRMIDRLVVSR